MYALDLEAKRILRVKTVVDFYGAYFSPQSVQVEIQHKYGNIYMSTS